MPLGQRQVPFGNGEPSQVLECKRRRRVIADLVGKFQAFLGDLPSFRGAAKILKRPRHDEKQLKLIPSELVVS